MFQKTPSCCRDLEAKSCGGLPAPEGGPALRPWANVVLATFGHLQRLPDEAAEAGVAGSYGPNRPVTQDCDAPATCCPEPSPNLSSSLFLSLFVLVQDDVLWKTGFKWTLPTPDGSARGSMPVLPQAGRISQRRHAFFPAVAVGRAFAPLELRHAQDHCSWVPERACLGLCSARGSQARARAKSGCIHVMHIGVFSGSS